VAAVSLKENNALVGVWPMVAMNVVLAGINIFFIVRMLRERDDDQAYAVLPVHEDDAYLTHFLGVHRADIDTFFRDFSAGSDTGRSTYLVQHGDETAGVIVVRDEGDGVAQVELDYVTPRFRDFSPGEFVFRRSGMLRERGFTQVLTPSGMVAPYYERVGFARHDDRYRLDLA